MKKNQRITFLPAADDDKRVEAGGNELRSIQMLGMWANVLEYYEGTIEKLLRMIPNGWRQYRMIRATLEKLVAQIYDTLPNSTMSRIVLKGHALEMRLMPKSATAKEYFVLPFDDFLQLMQYVDDGACRMCLGDAETARKCPLRRILRDQVPPVEGTVHGLSACPYSDGILSIAAKEAAGQ